MIDRQSSQQLLIRAAFPSNLSSGRGDWIGQLLGLASVRSEVQSELIHLGSGSSSKWSGWDPTSIPAATSTRVELSLSGAGQLPAGCQPSSSSSAADLSQLLVPSCS